MLSPNDTLMSDEDIYAISREMSLHNSIFYTIWSVSKIYFSNEIETACISFDKNNFVLGIYINPEFWNSLNHFTKKFVIMHECLHIFFDHGIRNDKNYSNKNNNIAQDIVINETITCHMGLDRDLIIDWKKYCFIETCFKYPEQVLKNKTYDYYLKLLNNQKDLDNVHTVDDHSKNNIPSSVIEDVLDQFKHNASEQEIETIADIFENVVKTPSTITDPNSNNAGDISNPIVEFISVLEKEKVKKQKQTWLNLVKNITPSKKKVSYEKEEGWYKQKSQFSILDTDLMIVGEAEREIIAKKRYDIVVYIDISGSCSALVNPFYKLLHTFPTENFNIRTFTFNTSTREFDWEKQRPTSNGGTCFKCINSSVEQIKNESKHPDAVFVFTDGDGTDYNPSIPEKWVWILSKNNKRFIHNKSKTFLMDGFK